MVGSAFSKAIAIETSRESESAEGDDKMLVYTFSAEDDGRRADDDDDDDNPVAFPVAKGRRQREGGITGKLKTRKVGILNRDDPTLNCI